MASAKLIQRSGGATQINGFIQYDLVHIFEVIAPRDSSIVTILNWPGIPAAGAKRILGGETVWVGRPAVNHPNRDQGKFLVTVPYSNQTSQFERDVNGNPVSDPTQIAKRVSIEYFDESEPVTNAKLRSITKGAPEGEGGVIVSKPGWLPEIGPVTNSAGQPIFKERIKRVKHISVQRVVRDWSQTWDDYQGAINLDQVTIEVRDSEGVRATHVFEPLTLRMSIATPEEWKEAKLYFRPTFNMEHNPKTWIHSELDRGTERRIFVDQYKPTTGQYVQADLDDLEIGGDFGYESIKTGKEGEKVAIGEPVQLNGTGAEQPIARHLGPAGSGFPGSYESVPFYLNYDLDQDKIKPFAPLDL